MFDLIEGFPKQLEHALELAKKIDLKETRHQIKNIVINGLGGSGIGGYAVNELVADELRVPLIVNGSYTLPNFVSEETLIILSSYSGNTEEIVSLAKVIKEKKYTAVCITSGGTLKEIADEFGWSSILIPKGMPPRCGFGYSVIFQLAVLEKYQLISPVFKAKILSASQLLAKEQTDIKEIAKRIVPKLKEKLIGLFADQWFYSLVVRAKQQLNENSKSLCWANVFPEMNHNELVAWRGNREKLAVLFFRSSWENIRNTHRIAFSKEVIKATNAEVFELVAKGNSQLEQYFYLVHLADWLSFYLAEQQQYNPMEIEVLNKLKAHLSSIQ